MLIALTLGAGWAAGQPVLCALPPGMLFAWLLNGMVFGAYAAILYSLRDGGLNVTRAVLIGVLGASHFLWVLPATKVIEQVLGSAGLPTNDAMWIATALVLGGAISAASWQWWFILPPLLCLTAAGALVHTIHGWMDLLGFGLMTGAIHIGLLACLAFDTVAYLKKRWPPGGCQNCGYDLRGLPSSICPECGRSPDGPATLP